MNHFCQSHAAGLVLFIWSNLDMALAAHFEDTYHPGTLIHLARVESSDDSLEYHDLESSDDSLEYHDLIT